MKSIVLAPALALFLGSVLSVKGQNDTKSAVDRLFVSPKSSDLVGFEEVTNPSTEKKSIGALEKCGEGSEQGVNACVPYYQCDGRTKTIVQTGVTDGFGVIDIRFGESKCDHHLEVCCGIPKGLDIDKNPDLPEPVPTRPQPTQPRPTQPQPTQPYPTRKPTSLKCGIRNQNGIDFKISGNFDNEAEYGEFPWQVALLKKYFDPSKDKDQAICGGSLIAPSVVLTGAHCVQKFKVNEIEVRAGEWDTQTDKERLPYQERNVVNIVSHPEFHPKTLFNDFALLVLDKPVDTSAENIGTICLPEANQRIDSKNCFATGWGKDVFGKEGSYSVILKKIELPLVQHAQCERALRTTRLGGMFNLDKSFICAGGEEGRDTCTGDGGSPLVCPDPENPGRYVQAGIVAWGIGCGEHSIPGVYADVAKMRPWIDQQFQRLNIDTRPYYV